MDWSCTLRYSENVELHNFSDRVNDFLTAKEIDQPDPSLVIHHCVIKQVVDMRG